MSLRKTFGTIELVVGGYDYLIMALNYFLVGMIRGGVGGYD